MEPKRLSTLIGEMIELMAATGDGFIEGYNDHDATVPFVTYSEDDKQYYIDFAEEDDATIDPIGDYEQGLSRYSRPNDQLIDQYDVERDQEYYFDSPQA